MRVNIYGEELTQKIEVVKKAVNQELFYGIRFYLKSHPDLHHSDSDNDESAVTFWVPFIRKDGNNFEFLLDILNKSVEAITELSDQKKDGIIR